ncbi:porin family protein [Bradyrhizobium sp. 139]|uniref:outer membrane protein n=1 Tax=Bradyrhizobium sp. 139 TaxID=2782616 RepID=UPI001FF8B12F|nr:outer membrane protein [Bradyrhizobium sp. 139]MCK1743825.1 porin family protein [Bradyrhizobium sp. 139]
MTFSILRSARRFLSCAAAATPLLATISLTATSAIAADMTVKAPVVAPVPLWNGFYIGVHGGYGVGSSRIVDPSFAFAQDRFTMDTRGAIAGAQVGGNWQFDNLVVGAELDLSWASIKGSRASDPANILSGLAVAYHALATGTGRVGYAFDGLLAYVKGGVAWANVDYQAFTGTPFPVDINHQRTGLIGGVGLEYALTNNLSARAEYNYLYFGPAAIALTTRISTQNVDHDLHLLKLGVNYRFNGDAIVARY